MYSLLVRIKEDDLLLNAETMTSHELAAIDECIHDLLDTRGFPLRLETYMSTNGIVAICTQDGEPVELPEEWQGATIEFGWNPARQELKLIGDYIPVKPRQVSPHPWGKVSLKFIDYGDLDAD